MADKSKSEEQTVLVIIAAIAICAALWALSAALSALASFAEVFLLYTIWLVAAIGIAGAVIALIIRYLYGLPTADRLLDILQMAVESHYGIKPRALADGSGPVITLAEEEMEEEDDE